MNQEPDSLFERVRDGDGDAIGDLIETHLPQLVSFVRLRAGHKLTTKESISDLVQSTCREVLTDIPERGQPDVTELKVWLFQAAERKIVDRVRYWQRQRRNPERERAYTDQQDLQVVRRGYAAVTTGPSQELIAEEQIDKVDEAFSKLSDEYREVILLSRVVGLSHEEIGKTLNRSEVASRKLLSRALAELTRHL